MKRKEKGGSLMPENVATRNIAAKAMMGERKEGGGVRLKNHESRRGVQEIVGLVGKNSLIRGVG